jgi:hypothetical protein
MEKLQEALAWSLEEMEQGRMSIEECLARYPDLRPELQKLILTAQTLRQAPKVSPSVGFKLNARQRLITKLDENAEPSVTFRERIRRTVQGRIRPTPVRRRLAMSWLLISTIVLSVFAGGGVGVAYAADGAVPGDALYGVDLGVEALRMMFAFDQEAKAELSLHFADERLEELQELVGQGAPDEAIGEALAGYAHNLELAVQAVNQLMAGDGEEARETLRLLIQERFMLQNQILTQVRNQIATLGKGQIEEAIRNMEATQTQLQEMLSAGEGGPPDDSPGGPSGDGQGGPQDDPGGSGEGQGGNPDATPGGPADNAPGEGQGEGEGEGQHGSEATPFEKENEALRECMEEVEALVTQGDAGGLSQAAVRCGETIEGMMVSIAEMNQGDTQQAAVMAGLLNETLDEAVPLLNSLLANAPESAGTYIHQILEKCEYGKQEIDSMFGNGEGPGGPGDQGQGGQGGEGN